MPETSFHATLMCAGAKASLSSNSCHLCLPGSSAELDLPLICRTWQPTLLGTLRLHHFSALCLGDISCPCENNPEIWPGKRMVQNWSPGLLTFYVYLGQALWFHRKLELQGWSPLGKQAVPPTNITGTEDITTLAKSRSGQLNWSTDQTKDDWNQVRRGLGWVHFNVALTSLFMSVRVSIPKRKQEGQGFFSGMEKTAEMVTALSNGPVQCRFGPAELGWQVSNNKYALSS